MPQTAEPLVLAGDDRAELARWSRGSSPMLAERARIVLACAEPGSGVARVAAELGSTRMTVRKWRRRFAEDGPAGPGMIVRPGRSTARARRGTPDSFTRAPAGRRPCSTRTRAPRTRTRLDPSV